MAARAATLIERHERRQTYAVHDRPPDATPWHDDNFSTTGRKSFPRLLQRSGNGRMHLGVIITDARADMNYAIWSILYAALLLLGMVAAGEIGRRMATRRAERAADAGGYGIGIVDSAVFALLGLIIAFTFSGAVTRFDARRQLIVQETNSIGTAYLRLDLLPSQSQPALRQTFRRYVDSRLQVYRYLPDLVHARAELENNKRLQAEIWTLTLLAARDAQAATMLLVPALNEMFDIATTRTLSALVHPPPIIFAMLCGLAVIASALAGYGMARSTSSAWLHLVAFAVATSFAFYVIIDMEFPRLGLIRVDAFDQALVDLRASMD